MRRFWSIVGFLVFLPCAVMAQRGGGIHGGSMRVAAAAAPRVASAGRMVPSASRVGTRIGTRTVRMGTSVGGTHRSPGNARMNPNILTPVFPDEFTFNDAPGLGFDFPHLAAVSGNRPFRFGFGEGFRSGFGNGFGFSGFLLSPSVIVVDGQPGEPAPAEEGVSPEQVEAQGAAGADRRYSTAPYPSPYSSGGGAPGAGASASAQQTQSEEYVFVRRDGGLVFAVAYSWDRDGLHYVTREGIRKSMAVDAIDLNATQQFNEQRGLSFRLPA